MFATVCVLLTSLGPVMMSGTAVPWWAMAAGVMLTGGAAWWLGGRERGPVPVGSAAVAAQALLHSLFSLAQTLGEPASAGHGSLVQRWTGHLLGTWHAGPGTEHRPMATSMDSMGHATGFMHSMGATDRIHHVSHLAHMVDPGRMGSVASPHHDMGGMSPTGMLAAHLLAASVSGLWLAHGERAAFRVLRALAGWLTAPLRQLLRAPAPPHRPRVGARRDRSDRAPRRLLLTCAITSRGPPVGTAVAV